METVIVTIHFCVCGIFFFLSWYGWRVVCRLERDCTICRLVYSSLCINRSCSARGFCRLHKTTPPIGNCFVLFCIDLYLRWRHALLTSSFRVILLHHMTSIFVLFFGFFFLGLHLLFGTTFSFMKHNVFVFCFLFNLKAYWLRILCPYQFRIWKFLRVNLERKKYCVPRLNGSPNIKNDPKVHKKWMHTHTHTQSKKAIICDTS